MLLTIFPGSVGMAPFERLLNSNKMSDKMPGETKADMQTLLKQILSFKFYLTDEKMGHIHIDHQLLVHWSDGHCETLP